MNAACCLARSSSGTAVVRVVVPAPSPPVITPAAAALYVGEAGAFSAASSDPSGLALTYAWDFGDGTRVGGAAVSHAFAAPGTYEVTVTATNSAQKSASSRGSATVAARPQDGVFGP